MEVVVTTGAIRRANFPTSRYHQQNNTQFVTSPMLFLPPNQQCQSTIMVDELTTLEQN